MLQFGDPRTNIQNPENGEVVDLMSAIKVLVIGHKRDFPAYVLKALHSYLFEVTCVSQRGAALRLLLDGTRKFDLLLVDCPTNAADIHTFLEETRNIDVLSIVMSENDDEAFTINALMSGAFLVKKKPLTMEAVSHLCQYAIRERMRKLENHRNKNRNLKAESQEIGTKKNVNLGRKRKVRGESSKQATSSNYESNLEYHWSEDDSVRPVKKRACVDWTPELHAKFMNAVFKLGKGCYPKDILDLMAVPGLTRMQVASHLQKCRAENWKNDENYHKMSRDFTSKRANGKTFGRMPPIPINQHDQEESSKPIGFNLAMNEGHQNEVNRMTNQTERGSMMPGSNQRNREQHAGYTAFSFQSGYDSNQHEGFDRTISETFVDYIQPDAGQGVNHHTFSPDEIPASDDFFDFLKDLDGNGPNDNWIAQNIAQNHNYGTQDEEMSYKHM